MALVTVALFPPIFAFAIVFFRRVQALFKDVDEAESAMTTVLQENLTGIRVVRAFARQDFECAKFAERNARHRDCHARLIGLLGRYWGLSDLLCLGQVGLVVLVGGLWVGRGEVAPGDLIAFVFYAQYAIWPLRHLGRVLNDTGRALVALRRLGEILAEPEETDLELPTDPPRLRGAIEVRGLRFAFPEGGPALNGLDLRVGEGETLALLGPPGSGKSTFVQLLLRLHDYAEGSILLDGRELRGLGRRFVRSQVGVVLQEPFLYSKTIGANVRLGRAAASDAEVERAAEAAAVHGSIQEFERGYETLVGERGVTLSGGQRQRVALARALVKDPPILVLDDALSAVDVETEAQILDALRARRGVRTTILIAHRLSSTQHADRIVVLERGAVVQAGTHEELLREEGPYRRLWRIQNALEEEIAGEVSP
jgi:ATP-binding cassette subfamily B protein